MSFLPHLTHWGRVTHVWVSNLTIIGSDNGLSPGRRQAIIWPNAWILLIRTLGTNFSEILSKIHTFSFKKMHFKMSSAKWRQVCLGLNVLSVSCVIYVTVNSMWLCVFQFTGYSTLFFSNNYSSLKNWLTKFWITDPLCDDHAES